MKYLNLIMWVTQFGLSLIFPLCFFLLLGNWLQNKYGFGIWIMIVCGVIGFLTTISTARSCLQALLKAVKEVSTKDDPPVAFNDHA